MGREDFISKWKVPWSKDWISYMLLIDTKITSFLLAKSKFLWENIQIVIPVHFK